MVSLRFYRTVALPLAKSAVFVGASTWSRGSPTCSKPRWLSAILSQHITDYWRKPGFDTLFRAPASFLQLLLLPVLSIESWIRGWISQKAPQIKAKTHGMTERILKAGFPVKFTKILCACFLLAAASSSLSQAATCLVLHFVLHKSQGCGPWHGTRSRINKHAFERPIETWCSHLTLDGQACFFLAAASSSCNITPRNQNFSMTNCFPSNPGIGSAHCVSAVC